MEKTENLGLWLPEDSDPLEVSKLSENFERLDKASGGGSIAAIVSGMKVGDVTYSARNLEEESGGVLVALDQRTIDTRAYPGIPEKFLYWPYPVVLAKDDTASAVKRTTQTDYPSLYGGHFLNTEKFKYMPAVCLYTVSSSSYKNIHAMAVYDEESGTLSYVQLGTDSSPTTLAYYRFLRISEDRVLIMGTGGSLGGSGGKVNYYHNDLITVDAHSSADSNANTYIRTDYASVYKLDSGRILMLTKATGTTTGVRYTDDDFATVMSASVPSEMLTDIDRRKTMVGTANNRAYCDVHDVFHPTVIEGREIYVVCYPASTQGSKVVNESNIESGIVTDADVEKVFPVVYYSGDNGTLFSKRPLPDNCVEILKPFFEASKAVGVTILYGTDSTALTVRVGHHLYIRYLSGVYASSSNHFERYLYVDLNLKTNHIDNVSEALETVSYKVPGLEFEFRNAYVNKFVYAERDRAIYLYYNYDIGRFDLDTLRFEALSGLMYPGTSAPGALPIGPTHYVVTNVNAEDFRLSQKGAGGPTDYGLRLIDSAGFVPGASDRRSSTVFPAPNITAVSSSGGPKISSELIPPAMSEYNGDIYIAVGNAVYKIAKDLKQLPYIPNAYMKVLDEPVPEEANEERS